jgi:hypothetical protein
VCSQQFAPNTQNHLPPLEHINRGKQDVINVKDITKDVANLAHEWAENKGGLTGLETGFNFSAINMPK